MGERRPRTRKQEQRSGSTTSGEVVAFTVSLLVSVPFIDATACPPHRAFQRCSSEQQLLLTQAPLRTLCMSSACPPLPHPYPAVSYASSLCAQWQPPRRCALQTSHCAGGTLWPPWH